MATKKQDKKRHGYVSEAKGRIVVFAPEIFHQVVANIKEIEDSNLASEVDGKLAKSKPAYPKRNPYSLKEEKKGLVSEAYGQIKVFTPEVIHQIVDRIREAETTASSLDELLLTKKLAAKCYAQATFEIALEKRQIGRWQSDLKKVAQLYKDRDIVAFLEDPEVSFEDKTGLLSEKLGDTNHIVLNLVYWLITKRALDMLPDIIDEYDRLFENFDNRTDIARAQVTTAIHLDDKDKLKIIKHLSDMIGKKVILEYVIDPSIIGGIVVRIDDKLLDGSIKGELVALKTGLKALINEELIKR